MTKRVHVNKYAGMGERQDRRTRWRKRALTAYVMCSRKQAYETEDQAKAMARRKPLPLRAYPCPLCKAWHLTKRMKGPP